MQNTSIHVVNKVEIIYNVRCLYFATPKHPEHLQVTTVQFEFSNVNKNITMFIKIMHLYYLTLI